MKETTFHLRDHLLFALLTVMTLILCIGVGSVNIPFHDTAEIIFRAIAGWEQPSGSAVAIILYTRLPRVLCVALVGAMLALGGCAMQGLLRNPLADGSTLGVSSGASLGAALAILSGVSIPFLPFGGTAGAAMLSAFLSLVVLLALLLKHVSGVVVRLLKQAVETLGNGVVRCRPLLTGELQHLVPVLRRLLRLRLRRRSGGWSLPPARRERHHLARPGRPGGRRRRALGTGRHRKGDGVLLPPRLGRAAAELRQNLLQGERLLAGHTCIPFVVPVLGHGSHLLCTIWIRGRP